MRRRRGSRGRAQVGRAWRPCRRRSARARHRAARSEENTSELQSLRHLVCRLLLEKKKPIGSFPDILEVGLLRDISPPTPYYRTLQEQVFTKQGTVVLLL